MSTARDPVPLRGLYASPSISIPRAVQTIMARITDTHAGRLRYMVAQKEIYAPTMITSPWAKFSILEMPYTIV